MAEEAKKKIKEIKETLKQAEVYLTDLEKILHSIKYEKLKLTELEVKRKEMEKSVPPAILKTYDVVIKLGEADAESVSKETGRSYPRESDNLNQLVRMGYLRKYKKGHRVIYHSP